MKSSDLKICCTIILLFLVVFFLQYRKKSISFDSCTSARNSVLNIPRNDFVILFNQCCLKINQKSYIFGYYANCVIDKVICMYENKELSTNIIFNKESPDFCIELSTNINTIDIFINDHEFHNVDLYFPFENIVSKIKKHANVISTMCKNYNHR